MKQQSKHIAKQSRSSFLASFKFLPAVKRQAIYSVYAWCRETDDIVDSDLSPERKSEKLDQWQKDLDSTFSDNPQTPLHSELNQARHRFHIPKKYFDEMVHAMRTDIHGPQFANWDQLINYCYGVAGTVGLMSIEIFGYQNEKTRLFAENLGIALQLTNIARDVFEDSMMGRFYLPGELTDKYKISINTIKSGTYTDDFVQMMSEYAKKIDYYYQLAKNDLPREDVKSMRPSLIMGQTYYNLYQKLIDHQFDVFNGKIRLSTFGKITSALSAWFFPEKAL